MKVVVAPDSFGGTLTAHQVAAAVAEGWRAARPHDEVVSQPLSDGGEGLLDVVAGPEDTWVTTEVAGPLGHPLDAALLWCADGSAVIESARACGLALVAPERRAPGSATTYGVGQLLDAARELGATRIRVGLGGSATVDGGAGALTGLGFRPTVADGSGLKVGAEDLARVAAVTTGWAASWEDIEVRLLADVDVPLLEAASRFGPQKGVRPEEVAGYTAALERWAEVAARDLPGAVTTTDPGAGAAGGLGFGLAAALPGARLVGGAAEVAELVGLSGSLIGADLVITGEGRLDATTRSGKVVSYLRRVAPCPVVAVVGSVGDAAAAADLADVEAASPGGPGEDPVADVVAAAGRLAARSASPTAS